MIKKSIFLLAALWSVYSFAQTSVVDIPNISAAVAANNVDVPKNLPAVVVERGPYLQTGTPTSVIVKWRTDIATESVVNYGTLLGAMSKNVTSADLTTEHEVTLSGLTPNTKYYFNIGNRTEVLSESVTGDMYVITAPTPGTDQFVRAWIIGDPGTGNTFQRWVRDAYYNYVDTTATNPGKTDMMLFLGDNAYNTGKDSEYQNAFFDVYDDMFKKSVAWSCLGNHDGDSADSDTQSGPYYDIFTFPTAGEAGGTPSGTEAYYSFDYANIHFIILDSHHTSRAVGGPMYNWALTDIQNTAQDWIVTLFHHPAYSKGSHDSDVDHRPVEMRENFTPMLEANGVDLVLSGHSHSYERSYFLNGHQGLSNTFSLEEITNGGNTVGANGKGDGKEDGDGAYQKASTEPEGAVYITTGSAGQISGGDLNHQAMYISMNKLGSCVMEIDDDGNGGQNMVIKFIRETGEIDDYFTIHKTGVTFTDDTNEPKAEVGAESKKVLYVAGHDLLTITMDRNERLKKVKIYNNIGKLVKKSRKKTIDVSKMPKGMYAIEITTKNGTYIESVTIE
ncbi:metallophosphoesterase [Maribacter sp. ANRC-HE7]|uniref:Metallophosphoesterase n=1 Tax=Maribacter aquimaris TaxID=2737171 RepID=A0ABR7V2N6_9FLAO|nr:metallophosphoesterase [Maribacter aquimaris]MBD0777561.1 metallophosphoesterase [Maribacter aquimaris]